MAFVFVHMSYNNKKYSLTFGDFKGANTSTEIHGLYLCFMEASGQPLFSLPLKFCPVNIS
jgi:hypothetical protein